MSEITASSTSRVNFFGRSGVSKLVVKFAQFDAFIDLLVEVELSRCFHFKSGLKSSIQTVWLQIRAEWSHLVLGM